MGKLEKNKIKTKEPIYKTILRIAFTLAVVIIGIFLILYFVAKAARFDSLVVMLKHMLAELTLIWERIIA